MQLASGESSENLWRWQPDVGHELQSEIYKVNKNDNTVHLIWAEIAQFPKSGFYRHRFYFSHKRNYILTSCAFASSRLLRLPSGFLCLMTGRYREWCFSTKLKVCLTKGVVPPHWNHMLGHKNPQRNMMQDQYLCLLISTFCCWTSTIH